MKSLVVFGSRLNEFSQQSGAARRGAVVSFHTHKRGSERCMKWRKMADHVQVSRGFMFL